MKKILSSGEMRYLDQREIENGTSSEELMRRAATAVLNVALEKFNTDRTLVVCGKGNNGGDGVILSELLAKKGKVSHLFFACGNDNSENNQRLASIAVESGALIVDNPDYSSYTLIVDAIFGTGFAGVPTGAYGEIIADINNSNVKVLSVDIPSGVSADTGKAMGNYISADMTVAIESYKRGHIIRDGVNASGELCAVSIGIDTSSVTDAPITLEFEDTGIIPKRKRNTNKGTYGRTLIIGGSSGMCGAAYMSAMAAYRCGAGIVEIFTPKENRQILQTLIPEAIVTEYDAKDFDEDILVEALSKATVVVLGPGLSQNSSARQIVKTTYKNVDATLIVDADALNITANQLYNFPTDVPVIITPHPGEMARLCGEHVKDISRMPVEVARDYALENEVICVLKFARTVISDGEKTYVNLTGGPSLAKGGSGDILTGVIAGMLSSDLSPIEAAALGVYIHGAAGDITAKEMGEASPMARDVLEAIPKVLKELSK